MINKNFEALLEAEEKNPKLKEKAMELETKLMNCVKEYIALAAEAGILLTEADFNLVGKELTEEELAEVSGGTSTHEMQSEIVAAKVIQQIREMIKKDNGNMF